MSELKPCPFCGGEAELLSMGEKFTVSCGTGGCMASISWCPDDQSAIAAWNTRASDWIPCSERMPDDDERVLGNITITVNANMIKPKQRTIFAKHDRVLGWTTANGYPIVGKITHWMPLPDPPEENDA